jgi:hypothetical protein
VSQDAGEAPTEGRAGGLSEDEAVAEADDRIEDAEDEFGPDAPPRGATPGNPRAEEAPD